VQVASAQADAPVAPEAAQALITPPAAEAPKPAEKKEDAKKEEAKPAQEAPKPVEKKDEAKPAEATAEPAKDLTPKPLAPAQETEKKETPKPAEKKQEAQPAPTPAPEPKIVDADKKDEAAKAAAAVVVPKTTGAEQRAVQAVEDALKLADAGKFDDALSMLEKAAVVSENPKILEARKTVEAKRNEAQGARVRPSRKKSKFSSTAQTMPWTKKISRRPGKTMKWRSNSTPATPPLNAALRKSPTRRPRPKKPKRTSASASRRSARPNSRNRCASRWSAN
jgi:hypothetical protein